MSYSGGPSTSPKRPPKGNALRILGPIVAIPLIGMMTYNYFIHGHPLTTPGSANIEKAYSAGGATKTHTPGYGGSPRGNQTDDRLSSNPSSQVGGKQNFQAVNRDGEISHGDEHREKGKQSTALEKGYKGAMYGTGNDK